MILVKLIPISCKWAEKNIYCMVTEEL